MGFMTTMRQVVLGDKIKKQARRNNSIIYGGRSVNKHGKPFHILRGKSRDWDIFTNNPKKSAKQLAKKLNKSSNSTDYYVKQALYPWTQKVMSKGLDKKRGTRDDFNVADYTDKKGMRFPTVRGRQGTRYTSRPYEMKVKRDNIDNPEAQWRRKKESMDLYVLGDYGQPLNNRRRR